MFPPKHPFVRDGLLSIALAILWLVGTDKLCKAPEGISCDLSRYMLDIVTEPVKALSGKLMDLMFRVTGIVPAPPGVQTTHRGMDFLALSVGISLFLLYWFLLGGAICLFWRFVRSRIQHAFVKRGSPS